MAEIMFCGHKNLQNQLALNALPNGMPNWIFCEKGINHKNSNDWGSHKNLIVKNSKKTATYIKSSQNYEFLIELNVIF